MCGGLSAMMGIIWHCHWSLLTSIVEKSITQWSSQISKNSSFSHFLSIHNNSVGTRYLETPFNTLIQNLQSKTPLFPRIQLNGSEKMCFIFI